MGATFFSLAIQTPDAQAVRDQIVTWMDAKGYELDTSRRMTPLNPDQERGVYLFSNSSWTVALYSDIYEYDRLAFEMRKLKIPSLFLGCQDSDFWGYQLHDGNQLVDEFQTATSYFFLPQNVREPAWQLCTTLGIEDRFYEVCKLMRKRAIFSETCLQEFCRSLGIISASIPFETVDAELLGGSGNLQAVGYRCLHLHFIKHNSKRNSGLLHQLPLQIGQPAETSPEIVKSIEEAREASLPLFRVILFLFSILFFFLNVVVVPLTKFCWGGLRLISYLRWKLFGKSSFRGYFDQRLGTDELGQFLKGIKSLNVNHQRIDEGKIINDRFGCSIKLPPTGELSPALTAFELFKIVIDQTSVNCRVISESDLKHALRTFCGSVVCDENFTTPSGLKGRVVIVDVHIPHDPIQTISYSIVQSKDHFFQFSIPAAPDFALDREKVLKDLAMSFEILPEEGKNPSDVTALDGPAPQSGGENSRNPSAR